ncbi:hypothetical protein RRG08_063781 [Elysia crispata]|uniref:Uncharacterized protein n=1 Tax=Elysia crispata TaxID=231223 RepID=A0AAE1AJK6_9GAST|nr:hypothetical protein RRG08_063781 [Elysia crispata]
MCSNYPLNIFSHTISLPRPHQLWHAAVLWTSKLSSLLTWTETVTTLLNRGLSELGQAKFGRNSPLGLTNCTTRTGAPGPSITRVHILTLLVNTTRATRAVASLTSALYFKRILVDSAQLLFAGFKSLLRRRDPRPDFLWKRSEKTSRST